MLRIAFVRGAYLNNFEAQSYQMDLEYFNITGIGSMVPVHYNLPFPVRHLFSPADFGRFPVLSKLPIVSSGIRYIANRTLGDDQMLFGLESLAADFDLFHTADPHYYYSYQLAILRLQNKIKKLVITSWETIPFNNEKTAAKRHIKSAVLRAADWAICYTSRASDVLIKEGFSPDKISVLPLGVDLNKFNSIEKVSHNTINLLYVGRLVEEKGVIEVLNAVIRLIRQVPIGLQFQIVGTGPLKTILLQLIQRSEMTEKIHIISARYEDINEYYKRSSILIAPSKNTRTWEEQYGMVLIEAMACGLAVVSSRSGSIPEVVGDAALLVNNVTESSIYHALLKLVTSQAMLHNLGKRAAQRARERYDATITARKIGTIYQTIWNT